jgi:hypothetical protein
MKSQIQGGRFIITRVIRKGGEGSGNFGHEGRPGEVGGSGEGGAGDKEKQQIESAVTRINAKSIAYGSEQNRVTKHIENLPTGTRVVDRNGVTGKLENTKIDNGTSNRRVITASRIVWDNGKRSPWNGQHPNSYDALDENLSWHTGKI